mmetsp:Transcript_7663/g.24116  ORF Transcript_7663/g.24116 Transcript_7663/m.24116 type:complete len:444 (-) Transcript_7663:110-1441(-)
MLYLLEAIGIDRETLRGAAALASTAEGQSATAVLVVLVFWAVVTGRVYVVSRPAPPKPRLGMAALSTRSASEDGRPPLSPRPLSRRRTTSRKGSGLDDVDAGDAPPDEREIADGPLKPEDLAAAAGPAVRDPATHRLLLRDGAYWCGSPDAGAFKVRGENYLMDRVKVPVGDSVFKLLDCDLFDVDQPENHMARHLESRMAALWAESGLLVPSKRPFTWVIQLQVPGPPYKSFCMYYGCPDRDVIFKAETPFARVARRFFQPVTSPTGCGVNSDGGGEFGATSNDLLHGWRNNTFKLIPRCVNAPFLVKRAVGEAPLRSGAPRDLGRSARAVQKRGTFSADVRSRSEDPPRGGAATRARRTARRRCRRCWATRSSSSTTARRTATTSRRTVILPRPKSRSTPSASRSTARPSSSPTWRSCSRARRPRSSRRRSAAPSASNTSS